MVRVVITVSLIALYAWYSIIVYTGGTDDNIVLPPHEQQLVKEGKRIYQEKNCQACHQIYGLGGYLGPELTTAWSDKRRGEAYMRALLVSGGNRMPKFDFNERQLDALIAYFRYVDSTATPIKR